MHIVLCQQVNVSAVNVVQQAVDDGCIKVAESVRQWRWLWFNVGVRHYPRRAVNCSIFVVFWREDSARDLQCRTIVVRWNVIVGDALIVMHDVGQ